MSRIIEFKIHGVDKEYIEYARGLMKDKKLTPGKVINMKIMDI